MKEKTTLLYSNMDTPDFDYTKDYLFEEYGEEEGWETKDDIPDSVVYHEMDEMQRRDWDDFMLEISTFFDNGHYLLTGTCGRWNGPAEGGRFICSFNELLDALRHLDYMKFYDENGHFYISGYHRDGSDHYEVKRLTKKGYEYANRNYFAHDRKLHTTIMRNNFYSALPRIAERMYGT